MKKPFIMGCYGIGVPRLMAAIVEASHDENGIIWPMTVSPYQVYLIDLTEKEAERIYDQLTKSGVEVFYDDRQVSAGVKFADADLLGFPYRLVLSEKIPAGEIEVKKRDEKKSHLDKVDKIISELLR